MARKRGRGTVINTHICLAQPRIDEEVDFVELIRLKGMEPTVRLLDDRWVPCGDADLPGNAAIHGSGDEPLLCTERIFYGGELPLIYSRVYYKKSNLKFDYKKWNGYGELSLSEFLEIFCHKQPNTSLAELGLCKADEALSVHLQVPVGETLFKMADMRYTFDGEEIVSGYAVFRSELLPLKLLRRKI